MRFVSITASLLIVLAWLGFCFIQKRYTHLLKIYPYLCRDSQFCQWAKTCRYYPSVLKNTGKKNYSSVNILSTISKIFERCLLWSNLQIMWQYVIKKPSRLQKWLQHSKIVNFDVWKTDTKSWQTGEIWCPIDRFILSKVFYSALQNLLSAKQNAYGFDCKCIKLISSFLNNIKYRTKINSSFTNCKDLFIDIYSEADLGLLQHPRWSTFWY